MILYSGIGSAKGAARTFAVQGFPGPRSVLREFKLEHTLEYAALDIADVKVVVVFVDRRPTAEQFRSLEHSAKEARLDGNVVAVWPDEFGRTRFLAPPEQHEFFQVVSYDQLRAQITGTLS